MVTSHVKHTDRLLNRRRLVYRYRTAAAKRCHRGCCSWRTRPPFWTSTVLLHSLLSCSLSLLPLSSRYFRLLSTTEALPLFNIQFSRVRLPVSVNMAAHSLWLCHVNSDPPFLWMVLRTNSKRLEGERPGEVQNTGSCSSSPLLLSPLSSLQLQLCGVKPCADLNKKNRFERLEL